jgi:hypothetical protein
MKYQRYLKHCGFVWSIRASLLALGLLSVIPHSIAQNVPLISGGAAFETNTNGGNTTYAPTLMPLLALPVGNHVLFESRALLLDSIFPRPTTGYDTQHFIGVTFAQVDYIVNPHITLVGGYFLTPFGTWNERLSPVWINPLQDGPLIFGIGNPGSGSGTGGEIRGNVVSTENYSVDYTAYVSAGSTNFQISSSRSVGGRVNVYFPKAQLEVGTSYGRLLETDKMNAIGTHVWWEPARIPLKLRSEYAHGPHAQGYWVEADYRLSQFHGPDSAIGRLEPIFRIQQTFRNSPDSNDELPSVDTQRVDFGLDYHLPHEVRINTSYARQFSATRDANIWETELVYRFLFPTWKGKK